mgnify:CR=1 FL=1
MKTRGFTLLEMLIALTLMGLLFTALFSAFYTLSRSWDAADSRISQTEDRRLIAEFLRRQLSQAMVVKITNDKADNIINPVARTAEGTLSIIPVLANSDITGIPTIKPNTKNKKVNIEKKINGL